VPNGEDKNWVRLCAALDGFFVRYGRWPTRIRLPIYAIEDFRHLFAPESFRRLMEQFDVVVDPHYFAAESDGGRRYDYMRESFPSTRPLVPAPVWLDLHPDADETGALRGRLDVDVGDPHARYDVTLAGRQLFWLDRAGVVREVVRFLVYDLGIAPETVESWIGRRMRRATPPPTMVESAGPRALTPRDPDVEAQTAMLVRDQRGALFVLDDDADWRDYRRLLYRIDARLPFGTVSWKRSTLLTLQHIVDRLGLEGARLAADGYVRPPRRPSAQRVRPLSNCYWVSTELLLGGEYPSEPQASAVSSKLSRLLDFGVACFIDLTAREEQLRPYSPALVEINAEGRRTVEYHWHPILPGQVSSPARLAEILDTVDDALSRRLLVYVHDRGGLGRSTMVLGCHLTRRGLSGEAALERLSELVKVMPKAQSRPSPETEAQRRVVRAWPELDPQRAWPR
jgi:hypothetical protein